MDVSERKGWEADGFGSVVETYRRRLHVHCYRMLASFDEAEDAVQETFLRAWRGWDRFDVDGQLQAWLYRIATNICLDMLREDSAGAADSLAEVSWLQPYPDRLLDEVRAAGSCRGGRETISLAFLAALQVLPPRQRPPSSGGCIGLVGGGDGFAARDQRRRGQQRTTTSQATMQQSLPVTALRVVGRVAVDRGTELLAQFIDAHEEVRPCRCPCHRRPGDPHRHAAGRDGVPRSRLDRTAAGARLRRGA